MRRRISDRLEETAVGREKREMKSETGVDRKSFLDPLIPSMSCLWNKHKHT